MRHFLRSIFVSNPLQHFSTSVVVEVNVDIGQRDTVGIEETLKKEVVFHGVHHGDAKAISHHRTGGRATAWTHPNAQFIAGGIDIVLHHKEIARESHGFHDVELKFDLLAHMLRQWVAIAHFRPFVCQFCQVVGLELDSVEFVVATQAFDFLLTLLTAEHHVAVLILCELVVEVLLREPLAVFRLRSEGLRNLEVRHDWVVVDAVGLHFGEYLESVFQGLRHIGEDFRHLCRGLEPFLLGIEHSVGIVEVTSGGETDEVVMCLGILLIHEMAVVGAHQFDVVLVSQIDEHLVHLLLQWESLTIGTLVGVLHFMALEFQIEVIAEEVLEPERGFLRLVELATEDMPWNLSSQTS